MATTKFIKLIRGEGKMEEDQQVNPTSSWIGPNGQSSTCLLAHCPPVRGARKLTREYLKRAEFTT